MATATQQIDNQIIPNWKERIAGEQDPNDREIVAYQLGREDQKTDDIKKRRQLYHTNLELCCYYSAKFYDFLTKDKKIECFNALIKAEAINKFNVIFLITFDKYKIKQLRTDMFNLANEFRSALKTKDVCLEFNIIPMSENVDENFIVDDGYIWEYNNSSK